MIFRKLVILGVLAMSTIPSTAQKWLLPADTLNRTRANIAFYGGLTTYTVFSVGLYNSWYSKFDQSKFHLFDDSKEWSQMDKYGHLYTSYLQGVTCYKMARYTGLSENKSILTGIIAGTLFQSTLEVMDGFSTKWGFSLTDIGANLTGTAIFASQQRYWGGQRIGIKVNSLPRKYSKNPIFDTSGTSTSSLDKRAESLYGTGYLERFLKDYNNQVYWLSANVASFAPESKWPKWLNVAVGYGADNLYGGFENVWQEDSKTFILPTDNYPRIHQFYLGLDLHLTHLKPKNQLLRTVISALDVFKMPSPAIEINTLGQITFHVLR